MVYFFSNHTDTAFIESFMNDTVSIIKHPYIEPEWSVSDIEEKCQNEISQAVEAEKLVINGDYTLVAIILKKRFDLGKQTGFIAMKKLNEPSNEKDRFGNIIHRNILKPIGIRWV